MSSVVDLVKPLQYLDHAERHPLLCMFFTAAGCAPCQVIAPKFADLAARLSPEVLFCKVDVEEAVLADSFDVGTGPTWVLVRRGAEVHRLSGAAHKRPLRPVAQATEQHLLLQPPQQQPQQQPQRGGRA